MKNNKVFIIVVILVAVLASTITAYATTYLYASNEVSYDNSNSGISATNVQGAINELYDAAQDYSSTNARIDGYFRNNSTAYFTGNSLALNGVTDDLAYLSMYYNGVNRGTMTASDAGFTIGSRNSSGTWNTGTLNLRGDTVDIGKSTGTVQMHGTVKINGTNISSLIKSKMGCTSTSGLTNGTSVNTFLTVDSGYSFISYDSLCTSGGWVSSFPIYIANAHDINQAKLYWSGTLSSGNVCCYLLEIKS